MLEKMTSVEENKNENISIENIENFQKEFNLKLPNNYKMFLLKYNGGYPSPDSYNCKENQGFNICDNNFREESICHLYFYSLSEIKMYKEDPRIPKEFLAIANDYGSSNHICLGVSDKYIEKIYYWVYGDYMVSENEYSNIYFIADNFNELLDGLQEID